MDNIDRIMKEAERLGFGVSYGKFRAAYPGGTPGDPPKAPQPSNEEKPTVECRLCGKPFIVTHGNQQYCSAECSVEVANKRIKAYERRKLQEKRNAAAPRFCIVCGVTIPVGSQRRSYCSDECSKEGNRKMNRRKKG